MELTFECRQCGRINHVEDVESTDETRCRHCGSARELRDGAFDEGEELAGCPCCGSADLYVRKDFPQGLGLLIVVAGCVVSTVFWYYERPTAALLILLAWALVDMALYFRVPDVTICYRCESQLRGPGSNPDGRLRTFDLAIGERYRQERLRAEELRRRGAVGSPVEDGGAEPGSSGAGA